MPRKWWAMRSIAPTRSGQKLHVSQRRGDPLGRPRSFMPTPSFMPGTNKSRGVPRGGGRRGASPDKGEAVPRPHGPAKRSMCPNVGATHRVALGHSCQHARSWPGQTNREAVPRGGGRRGASPVKGEAVPRPTRSGQKLHVCQRRGDPLGRPRSFMPARSFMAGTNNSRGSASGRWAQRGASPDKGEAVPRPHGPAKSSMCPNVGATHWVALGHSCQHARSWLGQTNREAGPRPHGGPNAGRRRIRARQCLAPTRSGQHARSCVPT